MSVEHWQRVEAIFNKALEMPTGEREAYVDQACGGDEELRSQVLDMLVADDSGETRWTDAVGEVAGRSVTDDEDPLVGRRVGAYEILEKIAEGGMGAVYLAGRADEAFTQTVAIKFLTSGLISTQAKKRFLGERQILANLDHPNIARLLDGGSTEEGVPYLVMEHIDGVTLNSYCDQRNLGVRERLRLFQKVCHAVHYAHQNLIIHRDIKPSNILVTEEGEPKLLDFGIAKLVDKEAMDVTMAVTHADARVLTPQNASPEQVKGETITTATDVYALGVLLYQLLTGQFPYHITSYRPQEIYRAILETDPERPSTIVGRSRSDTIEGATSAPPSGSPKRLRKQLRGDLDNIVLVAMRKEPERRYPTVRQLNVDIDNYLEDRPVLARADSWGYRTSKFARRHRVGVATAVMVIVGAVALVTFYTVQLRAERDRAQLEATKAEEVSEFLTELFGEADPNVSLGETVSATTLLERGAERIDRELSEQPEIKSVLLVAIGRSYANMGEYDQARRSLRSALDTSRQVYGERHPEVAKAMGRLAAITYEKGQYDETGELLEEALDQMTAFFGPDSVEAASVLRLYAVLQQELGDYEKALQQFEEAIAILRGAGDEGRASLGIALTNYGAFLRLLDRRDDEREALLEALALRREMHGDIHPRIAVSLNSVGNHYWQNGDLDQGERYLQESLDMKATLFGEDNIRSARTRANLAMVQYQRGEYTKSAANSTAALSAFRQALGEDHPHVAFLMENLANALLSLGEHQRALEIYQSSLTKVEAIFGADHLETARSLSNLGGAFIMLDAYDQAEAPLREANRILTGNFGPENGMVVSNLNKLAEAVGGQDRLAEAETIYRDAIAMGDKVFDVINRDTATSREKLGINLINQGRHEEAEAMLRQGLEHFTQFAGEESFASHRLRGLIGHAMARQGRFEDGEALLLASHGHMLKEMGAEHRATTTFAFFLVELYEQTGRPREADRFR